MYTCIWCVIVNACVLCTLYMIRSIVSACVMYMYTLYMICTIVNACVMYTLYAQYVNPLVKLLQWTRKISYPSDLLESTHPTAYVV